MFTIQKNSQPSQESISSDIIKNNILTSNRIPIPIQQVSANSNSTISRFTRRNQGIQINKSENTTNFYETFQLQSKNQNEADVVFITKVLSLHFVFSALNESQLSEMSRSMFYCNIQAGETIMKQGDNASSFFIIEKGKMDVLINGVNKKSHQLHSGDGFGEMALLYESPRSATIKAVEETFLWAIDRSSFRKTVELLMKKEQKQNRKIIEKVKFFNQLTDQQKDAIASALISQKFSDGQVIVNEGDQASSYYVIAEGQVGIYKEGQFIRTMVANESFGEMALSSQDSVRSVTVSAFEGEAKVLALGREMIAKILGDQIINIIYKNICKWALQNSSILQKLPAIIIDQLLDSVQFIHLKAQQIVINQGQENGQLIVVIEGQTCAPLIKKGEIILEETLMESNRGGKHPLDVVMEVDGIVGVMNLAVLLKASLFKEIANEHQKKSRGVIEIQNQIADWTVSDLVFLANLGSGQFGHVYLVKFKGIDQLFALKYVTRAHVKSFSIQKHIQQERQVLSLMDHQFILQFYRSFKDDKNIYFLTEFIPGYELFDAIRVIGLLSKIDSQFYVAQMILQMEYLHTIHNIVYRDIKPENLMVDEFGYLKLIDMGTAKLLNTANGGTNKTFTIIGTPHYMAPEVISGKGYNYMVDLWSIGVCLYEFISGGLPFGEDAEDPFDIYQEIIKKNVTYPVFMSDNTAKSFIEQIMQKMPELRLGGNYSSLKAHPWLKGFNWEQLMQRQTKAPVLPPKEKNFTQAQIKELEKKKISVVDQIGWDRKDQKFLLATPQDLEWDHQF